MALLPRLEAAARPGDPARVQNVGSIDGLHVPGLETYGYSSTKAALHHLTRVLARKLASHYQGVTCLEGEECPGAETFVVLVDGTSLETDVAALTLGARCADLVERHALLLRLGEHRSAGAPRSARGCRTAGLVAGHLLDG